MTGRTESNDGGKPYLFDYSPGQIWLGKILKVGFRLLGLFSDVVFRLIYGDKTDKLPPIRNLLLLESATSLAEQIRQRKVTSEHVVKSFMERIRQVNPIINCVTENRFQAALEEARAADALVEHGGKTEAQLAAETPFLGVPFTTKDSIAVSGMLMTGGLWSRRNRVAKEDAPVVALMRGAGAIPLAHTNVPELCMWWETANKIYGRSRNPYRTCRITGGSSGGEGALLAAAGSPMGIGSDIGGSIRMPSFFNGIFGLKPSSGMVSNAGQVPVAVGELDTFQVTGPMCRFARDLLPIYRVLSSANSHRLRLTSRPTTSKLRFFYMSDNDEFPLSSPVHADLRASHLQLKKKLEHVHGVKVHPLRLRAMFHQLEMWTHKMHSVVEAPTFAEELGDGGGAIRPGWELAKWLLLQSNHTLPGILLAMTERWIPQDPTYVKMCDDLKQEMEVLLGEDGVLLYPTHPTPAPYQNQALFKGFNFAYTAVFNVLELPVVQVPLGLGSWGVPLGIQVVAGHGRDHICLAVAEELEKLAGGWVCPSEIE